MRMRMILLMFVLAGALQSACSFGNYVRNGVCVPDLLINTSTIILMISLGLVGMIYMLSAILEDPKLASLAKNELYNLLGTAVIVGLFLGSMAMLDALGPAFYTFNFAHPGAQGSRTDTPTSWTAVQAHAVSYVQCVFNYGKNSIKEITYLMNIISFLTSINLTVTLGPSNIFTPLVPGVGGVGPSMTFVIMALTTAMVQLKMQIGIMGLWLGIFNIILPLGIVLRSFSMTRSAGAAMIAVTIGLAIILPLMYLFIEDVSTSFIGSNVCVKNKPPNIVSYIFSSKNWSGMLDNMMEAMRTWFSPGGSLYEMSFRMAIEGTLLPLFAYTLTLMITKNIADLLGGEVDFSSMVRFI